MPPTARRGLRNRTTRRPFSPQSPQTRGPAVQARFVAGSRRGQDYVDPDYRSPERTFDDDTDLLDTEPVNTTRTFFDDKGNQSTLALFGAWLTSSPQGRAFLESHSPTRHIRSLEDVLFKVLHPDTEDENLKDLDVSNTLTPPALALLMEILLAHRTKCHTAAAMSYDAQLDAVTAALQAIHPIAGGPTVNQLELAAATRARTPIPTKSPPRANTPPKTVTVDELFNAALYPTKGFTLSALATPDQAKVMATIIRAARAKLPLDDAHCNADELKRLAYEELDILAPGHTSHTLEQLAAASVPRKEVRKSAREHGQDRDHLGTFDSQTRHVCDQVLDDASSKSDDPDTRPAKRETVTVKRVPYEVSPELNRRTSATQMRAFWFQKNAGRQTLAVNAYGPNGDQVGASEAGLLRCVKNVQKYFQNFPTLRIHIDAVAEVYPLEVATYDRSRPWTGRRVSFTFPPRSSPR